ncbi:hypothetical protein [Candidatus Poriferisocius sp.]|uniref:hypothetical protein n=1 Tax=Candidatus Poriferisocius sp. TaxID=3101276 RepID=UPI003B01745D
MAQRLCAGERARIETMVGTAEMARRLGRSRSAAWRELWRKPRSRCEQAKRSVLGDFRPIAQRFRNSRHPSRGGPLGR